MSADLRSVIRSVPDFPKKGIIFRDITTLLKDPAAVNEALDQLSNRYAGAGVQKVACIEARGFILGGALAQRLHAGFVPIRKPGKLPADTIRRDYDLEYGTDAVEIHKDAIQPGELVVIHDDLLATGGTAAASCKLVESLGGKIVGIAFLVELSFLKGRKRLEEYDIFSIIDYASE
jgi:adenine phosphoribosyltransferase